MFSCLGRGRGKGRERYDEVAVQSAKTREEQRVILFLSLACVGSERGEKRKRGHHG